MNDMVRVLAVAGAVLVAGALTGCGPVVAGGISGTSSGVAASSGLPATPSVPASSGVSVTPAAPPTSGQPASPGAGAGGSPPPAPAPNDCAASATVRIGSTVAAGAICLPVNGKLTLSAGDPGNRWAMPVSSDPRILNCTSGSGQDRMLTATCQPHLPGTVTVRTTGGAPGAVARWELRVNVVAYGLT